jgi:hypothetical protein
MIKQVKYQAVIDRIEGSQVVLIVDERVSIDVPKKILPKNFKEGDVLTLTIAKDDMATEERKAGVEDLIEKLKKR